MGGSDDFNVNEYVGLIEKLLGQLKRLPAPMRKKLEKELKELLRLVKDNRPARFVLVGRRGAGKSTLVNAIFGARVAEPSSVKAGTQTCDWRTYQAENGKKIEILDTRGVQEGQGAGGTTPEQLILDKIKARSPDAILYLHKAKEVDAAVGADLDSLEQILVGTKEMHGIDVPVVGVITQADELDPPDVRELPTDDEEKNENIEHSTRLLREALASRPLVRTRLVTVLPTVAYMRFRRDGTVGADYRWNIDKLVQLLVDELPDEAKLDFARLAKVRSFQRKVARSVIVTIAGGCAAIGAEPIPGADLPVLLGIQASMIVTIAFISGQELSLKAARDFIGAMGANVGAGFALREIARGLVKLVPGYGNVVSGAVAAAGTYALGEASIAFYIDEKSIEEARAILKKKRNG